MFVSSQEDLLQQTGSVKHSPDIFYLYTWTRTAVLQLSVYSQTDAVRAHM